MSCKHCGDDWYGQNPTNRQPLSMEPDLCPECEDETKNERNEDE